MLSRALVHPAALAAALLALLAAPAARPQGAADEAPKEDILLQYPGALAAQALRDYEALSGLRIIPDATVGAVQLNFEIAGSMTRAEAARALEKALLLQGVALIPSGPGEMKAIAAGASAVPRSEEIAVITRAADLPDSDRIVTFVLHLRDMDPAAALAALQQIPQNHSYGSIQAIPGTRTLVITENSALIKKMLDLVAELDVAPLNNPIERIIAFQRADAETAAEAITELLGLGGGAGGAAAAGAPIARPVSSLLDNPPGEIAPRPQLKALPRINSILALAAPADMERIERLARLLDLPDANASFASWTPRWIPVKTLLGPARDLLLRGVQEGQAGGAAAGGASSAGGGQQGGAGSSSIGGGIDIGEPEDLGGPESLLIGKTLVIADGATNELLASGPPEQLRSLGELIAHLDRRPKQIYIATVIGQLTLGDDFDLGFDLLRTLDDFSSDVSGAGTFKSRIGASQALLNPNTLGAFATLADNAAQGISIYGNIGSHLSAAVSALESTSRFEVLSRPSVFTLNNTKAIIATGQQVAVPTSTLTSLDNGGAVTSNIEFKDIALKLEVIPMAHEGGEITLRVSQTNNDIIGSTVVGGNEIPTIATQEYASTVIVPSGSTVLLGGLISESARKSRSGLPIFTRIPWVRNFFGSQANETDRRELVILIQPRIVEGPHGAIRDPYGDMHARGAIAERARDWALPKAQPLPRVRPANARRQSLWRRLFGKRRP